MGWGKEPDTLTMVYKMGQSKRLVERIRARLNTGEPATEAMIAEAKSLILVPGWADLADLIFLSHEILRLKLAEAIRQIETSTRPFIIQMEKLPK